MTAKRGALNVEGAISAGLRKKWRIAAAFGGAAMERHQNLTMLAAQLMERGYFSEDMFVRVTTGDPIRSITAQTERTALNEWARELRRHPDATPMLGAVSDVLGVDQESGRPVLKKDMGIRDEPLEVEVRRAEFGENTEDTGEPRTMDDQVTLQPGYIKEMMTRYPAPRRFGAVEDYHTQRANFGHSRAASRQPGAEASPTPRVLSGMVRCRGRGKA